MSETGRDGIQGEGDYDAARRYREHTERFVKEHAGEDASVPPVSGADEQAELDEAQREVRRHAKVPEQDARDAELMRRAESKAGEGAADLDAEIEKRGSGRSGAGTMGDAERDVTRLPPD